MFEHKVLTSDPIGSYPDQVTDGSTSWQTPQIALDELGAAGWELVSGWRNDYKDVERTSLGVRENIITQRELLLKREVGPVKGWAARLFKR